MLGITESASQQHIHRARRRITNAGNNTDVDQAAARRIVEAFVTAAASGRTEQLIALLTDDATGLSDSAGLGLGLAETLIRFTTPRRLAEAMRAFKPSPAKRRLVGGSPSIHAVVVNGCPAMLAALDDRVLGVTVLEVRDDRIAGVRGITDPRRLDRLAGEWRRRAREAPLIGAW
ncbi:hypothetical protein [Nocardia acididurans]|uniref:hypothetical protein n=1 Tax=Nocardia acididurans TaxID=2802282 RepID=UPI001E5C5130|nr:hypothetical protein [Nocardia acididurans]